MEYVMLLLLISATCKHGSFFKKKKEKKCINHLLCKGGTSTLSYSNSPLH